MEPKTNETPEQIWEDLPEILRQKFYKSNMDAIAFMAVCYRMGEDACRNEMFTEEQVIQLFNNYSDYMNDAEQHESTNGERLEFDKWIKQIKPPTP